MNGQYTVCACVDVSRVPQDKGGLVLGRAGPQETVSLGRVGPPICGTSPGGTGMVQQREQTLLFCDKSTLSCLGVHCDLLQDGHANCVFVELQLILLGIPGQR